MLEIKNLQVKLQDSGQLLLKGLDLSLKAGQIHYLMGPNGSGKSTLAQTLIGNPEYDISAGEMLLNSQKLSDLSVHERIYEGLFVSFQNPPEVPGVVVSQFLKSSLEEKAKYLKVDKMPTSELLKKLKLYCAKLGLSERFYERGLNEGMSGGEKKKLEILQMLILNPKCIILDEIDSGLDVDAITSVCESIRDFLTPTKSLLVVTHNTRLVKHLKPDVITIIKNGQITDQGGIELIELIEKEGFKSKS